MVKLENSCLYRSGIGFPKSFQGNLDNEIPFYKVRDISETVKSGGIYLTQSNNYVSSDDCTELRGKLFLKGTIVFAKIGEAIKLNRRAIISIPSLVDNNVMGISSKDDSIHSKYLYYFMLTIKLGDISRATTVPSVRKSDVENIKIPIAPEKEQIRLVSKLEELFTQLDAGVESLNKAKLLLKRYRQSVLKSAMEGKLTAEWRKKNKDKLEPASELLKRILKERREKWETEQLENFKAKGKLPKNDDWKQKYKEPKPYRTNGLPSVPDEWSIATTSVLCESVRDGTHDTPKYTEKGVPLVTSKNLKSNGIFFSTARNISLKDHNEISKRSGVAKGDVLFAMIGTIGNPVVVDGDEIFSIKNVALFKENNDIINSYFLKYWLESPLFKQILNEQELLKGTTQKFIPLEHLRIIPVPLPVPEEQKEIVNKLSGLLYNIDCMNRIIEHEITRSTSLRNSILNNAFSGKLVSQDPSDEPASKLLERIKSK